MRIHGVIISVSLLLLSCPSEEEQQEQRAKLKQELKAELLAELRAELGLRRTTGAGERAAPVETESLEPEEPPQEEFPPPVMPRPNSRTSASRYEAAPGGDRPGEVVDESEDEVVVAADSPIRAEPKGGGDDVAPAAEPAGIEEAPAGDGLGDPTPAVSGLELIQLVVAERVNRTERIPEAPSSSFDSGLGKIFAFAVIKNPGERTQVQFQWLREGKVVHSLPLKVGQSKRGWRTWASTRISRRTTGRWEVRVLDDTGALLGKRAFAVQ